MTDYTPEILEYVKDWATSTEKIVGSRLKKEGVEISHPELQNIVIDILQTSLTSLRIQIKARDALLYTQMGAGRGWRKGVKLSTSDSKGSRRRKPIWNKPIYSQIAKLSEVIALQKISEVRDIFTKKKL